MARASPDEAAEMLYFPPPPNCCMRQHSIHSLACGMVANYYIMDGKNGGKKKIVKKRDEDTHLGDDDVVFEDHAAFGTDLRPAGMVGLYIGTPTNWTLNHGRSIS